MKAKNLTAIYKTMDLDTNVKAEEINAIIKAEEINAIIKAEELDTIANTREMNTTTKGRDFKSVTIPGKGNGITKTSLTTEDVDARPATKKTRKVPMTTTLRKPRKLQRDRPHD